MRVAPHTEDSISYISQNIAFVFLIYKTMDEPRLELGVHRLSNSLDSAPSSIVIYLEMKVEVGVHDIWSRFTSRLKIFIYIFY